MQKKQEEWSGRIGFILSTMGSAIGLGSIWKFPYEVGSNGGGAFVFCYLMGLLLIVFPLMLVEFAIGRRGRSDAVGSISLVADESGSSRHWQLLGAVGVVTSFLILSFYSVIGGWALSYAVDTVLNGLSGDSASAVQARFDALLASPWSMTLYHALFMAVTALIVARGVAGGIESACKVLMPVLIVLVVVLALYSMSEGDVYGTLRFLFGFDRELISAKIALEALGLGFFSIGVGLAVMITYASYAGPEIDLRQVAIATIVGDTMVSCLAGLAVFPIVFVEKLDPASGPGLMFVTLPLAFARLPFGTLVATAFFVLLAVAGLASAISMLEMPVAFLQRRIACSRRFATVISAAACWVLGLLSVLSFNVWADWFPLASIQGFAKASVFDLLDQLTSNMLLPAGSFALALFGGWVIPTSLFADELRLGPTAIASIRVLLRYVVPCGIAAASFASLRF
jgi:neurotransmitter:Na+ symporter, NSS family